MRTLGPPLHYVAKCPHMSGHLIEPSHDLNNQIVSQTDVFMAK